MAGRGKAAATQLGWGVEAEQREPMEFRGWLQDRVRGGGVANFAGMEAKAEEVEGLLLAVMVDLVAYFLGELAKDAGGAESVAEGYE